MATTDRKIYTLVSVLKDDEILLGLKKRGFGVGWWNGFGGKINNGETIEEAAKRELFEESGLTANELIEVGVITFEFISDPQLLEVHVFRTHDYTGTPIETEEMKPQWFNHNDIPYDQMWTDDILWYPLLLSGKKFNAFFKFQGLKQIIDYSINEIHD